MQSNCSNRVESPSAAKVVLVVDDEFTVLTTVCKMLLHAGFVVLAAVSPAEALRLAGERPQAIDLMLCDIVMPGMSGPQMARQFAILHPETKLLFMAGLPDGPEVAGILERGLPFLPKPFYPAELVAAVRDVLAGNTAAATVPGAERV